ncbi:hypothetical protein [Fulvivirga ligni]|uniref:hypothetical protein n=1 Tax=Fulvivirga ligni TaxID=2904246 RepID=UPI001F476FA5|nr:hypothetical protein [Fulvivirga ligni]UII23106.1 hypothetical protein LVD16_07695 [Fulvivirga ligni]
MEKTRIEKEVDSTMSSMDNLERATVKPFFYTRLQARMNKEREYVTSAGWKWSMAAVILLLVMNAFTLLQVDSTDSAEGNSDEVELLSQEYSVSTFDIYEEDIMIENE